MPIAGWPGGEGGDSGAHPGRVVATGAVELRSGTWDWSMSRAAGGWDILFKHRKRRREEMRAWTATEDPGPMEVERCAKDPILRTWIDISGARWDLTLERSRGRTSNLHSEIDPELVAACSGHTDDRLGEHP